MMKTNAPLFARDEVSIHQQNELHDTTELGMDFLGSPSKHLISAVSLKDFALVMMVYNYNFTCFALFYSSSIYEDGCGNLGGGK